jgi:two-component system chemotaxis response regulator CheB
MPRKNGIEALKEMKKISSCEVIMLSSLTYKGSQATMEALRIGAFDFIQKPSGSISLDIDKVKDDLSEKIRYAGNAQKKKIAKPILAVNHNSLENIKNETTISIKEKRIDAVLIGASTGGPRVLYDLITKLPSDIGVPVFVVQHMPAGFTKAFAERINKNTELKVVEASDGDYIIPNKVYVAPGGYHMVLHSRMIKLELTPPMHGVRPAVDKLFLSAADIYGGNLLCCVLTGMGRDGAEGLKTIKSKGGVTIAQDETTSTVYGMPKAAFETGCVDMVLPDNLIPQEIKRIVKGV